MRRLPLLLCVILYSVSLSVASDSCSAQAQTISWQSAWNQSAAKSFDVKLAQIATRSRKADVKVARADFFPTLQASFSSEYDKGLSNDLQSQSVAFVASTPIVLTTRFQEAFSLYATHTLYDAGSRWNTYTAAKRIHQASSISEQLTVRDLKLTLLDVYSQALIAYKSLKAKEHELPLYRELFQMKQRLYDAGSESRVNLGEQALQLAQIQDDIKQWRETLTERLRELGSYTHVMYSVDDVRLLDFDQSAPPPALVFRPEAQPDYKMFNLQIQAKKAELKAIGAQRFPQVRLYSSYSMYGTDNNFANAVGAIRGRVWAAGVSLSCPVFDGFKNQGQRDKKKAEIAQLETERDRRLWDLQSQFAKAYSSMDAYTAQLQTKAEIINQGTQKVAMYERLSDSKMMDRTALLNQEAQLTEQQLAAERVKVQNAASAKKIEILTGE